MQSTQIRKFILDNLSEHQKDIVRASIRKFGISRQGILRHLNSLIHDGKIAVHGKTKDRYYEIIPSIDFSKLIPISDSINENNIGVKYIFPYLNPLPKNVSTICEYGFSNAFNNILSHSNAHHATIGFKQTSQLIQITVQDDGIGCFENIKDVYGLSSYWQAAFDLVKGKTTVAPDQYLGESLFFILRLFDVCKIQANGLCLTRKEGQKEWALTECDEAPGTKIILYISSNSKKEFYSELDEYSVDSDSHGFNRTVIPISLLLKNGEKLMSRTQAHHVLRGLNLFREVCIDFQSIEFVSPTFIDEIFRVYDLANKRVHFTWINAIPAVEKMIWRTVNREKNGQ